MLFNDKFWYKDSDKRCLLPIVVHKGVILRGVSNNESTQLALPYYAQDAGRTSTERPMTVTATNFSPHRNCVERNTCGKLRIYLNSYGYSKRTWR